MASIHSRKGKRGTTHKVMWRLSDGRQRSKTFKVKEEAKAFRNDMERLEQEDRAPDPQRGTVTVQRWSEDYMGTLHVKPKTRVNYESLLRSRILPVFGDTPLKDITRLSVQQWVADMADEVSASRTNAAYVLLNSMLREAVNHDRLMVNPAEGIKLPKSRKQDVPVLTLDELRAVAAHSGRYGPLVMFLGVMGVRWAEAIGLTPDKVSKGVVTIDGSLSEVQGRLVPVSTKTWEVRRLPVPPAVLDMLDLSQDYVFTTTYGNPLRSGHFRENTWWPALKAAGVQQIKIHHLRHTCASLLIQQGANPKMVQEWLGHKDISITMNTYSHLFPSDLDNLADRMNTLLSKTIN